MIYMVVFILQYLFLASTLISIPIYFYRKKCGWIVIFGMMILLFTLSYNFVRVKRCENKIIELIKEYDEITSSREIYKDEQFEKYIVNNYEHLTNEIRVDAYNANIYYYDLIMNDRIQIINNELKSLNVYLRWRKNENRN